MFVECCLLYVQHDLRPILVRTRPCIPGISPELVCWPRAQTGASASAMPPEADAVRLLLRYLSASAVSELQACATLKPLALAPVLATNSVWILYLAPPARPLTDCQSPQGALQNRQLLCYPLCSVVKLVHIRSYQVRAPYSLVPSLTGNRPCLNLCPDHTQPWSAPHPFARFMAGLLSMRRSRQ